MDYIEKLELQTEEVKEVETLEKHTIINEPISVNKYNGHTREFLAIDGDYNDGFKQLKEVDGLGISCIVSKEVKEAREDVNGIYHENLKARIDSEVNEINSTIEKTSYKSINHYKLKDDKDYTEAFRRYFNELKSGKRVTLKINIPVCEISEQIQIPYGVVISIVGDGQNSIVKYVGSEPITIFNGIYDGAGKSYIQGEIRNITFLTDVSGCILFKQVGGYTNKFDFNNCVFNNFYYSLWIEKAWWTNIVNCDFINGENGIKLFDSNSNRIINSYFRFMTGAGITYDTDLNYEKKGTAGIGITNINFEQVDIGIKINSPIYSGQISGCYWEVNKNRYSIYMEDSATMSNFVFSGNYARYDNMAILKNIRSVTIVGGHMAITLPETTTNTYDSKYKAVDNLIIINHDSDFVPIRNKKVHENEIFDLSFFEKEKAWSLLTSNPPFCICKDEITLEPNEEITVATTNSQRTFRFLNFTGDAVWKANVRVYKGDEMVYNVQADIGEGSYTNPLYSVDNLSSVTAFRIKIANETTNRITIRNFTASFISNVYKS